MALPDCNHFLKKELAEMTENLRQPDLKLYEDIGALKAMSTERTAQTAELFTLMRGLNDKVATKDDLTVMASRLERHIEDEDRVFASALKIQHEHSERLTIIEADRKAGRRALVAAFGFPSLLAALLAIWNAINHGPVK